MPDIVCQIERKNIYLVEICGEYIFGGIIPMGYSSN